MLLSHHATCVAYDDRAVLITGQSGTGKSALALDLLGLGCALVADDRTNLANSDGNLIATCPRKLSGLIEARGVGILKADTVPSARVVLVVDLDQTELTRLPQRRVITVMGCDIPLIWRVEHTHFGPAVLQILKSGWND